MLEYFQHLKQLYLDFLGGIATNILGHAHPSIISAVSKQVRTLNHVSNFYSQALGKELLQFHLRAGTIWVVSVIDIGSQVYLFHPIN